MVVGLIDYINGDDPESDTLDRVFRNSGKDYNDLGRYEDCINLTDYRYILATVPRIFPIPMSVGICVPKSCTVEDFNAHKSIFVSGINLVIPDLFAGIKGFDLAI